MVRRKRPGVRTVRDQAGVLKVQLQDKIGREVEADEPIVPWLIRWAAMSVSRLQVGKDGNTPDQRQKGRVCDLGVVPLGEVILYRVLDVARDRHQSLE